MIIYVGEGAWECNFILCKLCSGGGESVKNMVKRIESHLKLYRMPLLIKILHLRMLFRVLAGLLLLAGLLVWTVAWWLPPVLPWVLQQWDVEVSGVRSVEEGGWQIDSLLYPSEAVEVRVADLQLPSMRAYISEYWAGEYSSATRVSAGSVEVRLADAELTDDAAPADETGAPQVVAQLREVLTVLSPWLPEAALTRLQVFGPSGELWLEGDDLLLRQWTLTGGLATSAADVRLDDFQVHIAPASEWTLDTVIEPHAAALKVIIAQSDATLPIQFEISSEVGRLDGRATFADASWLPVEASLVSEGLDLPTSWFPSLAKYTEPTVRVANLKLEWADARYACSFDLFGGASLAAEASTPVSGAVVFSGDVERLVVEQVDLSSEWAQLHLTAPLVINLADRSTESAATLRAEVDLGRQSMLAATGQAFLEIEAQPPTADQLATFGFDLRLEEFVYQEKALGQLAAQGRLVGDLLELKSLSWQGLNPGEQSLLNASGSVNLSTRAVVAAVALDAEAAPLNALLGQPLLVGRVLAVGEVAGSLDAPIAELSLQRVEIDAPGVEPVLANGVLRYGVGNRLDFTGALACQGAMIKSKLSTVWDERQVVLQFDELSWADPERPVLNLMAPTSITYQYADTTLPLQQRLSLAPFELMGTDLEARGSLDGTSGARLAVRGVSLGRIDRWLEISLPAYFVEAVELQITQWQPSIFGKAYVLIEETISDQERLRFDLNAELDASGVNFTSADVRLNEVSLIKGGLRAPVQVQLPTGSEKTPISWDADGRLEGSLTGRTTPGLIRWLERTFGVLIGAGRMDFEVTGTPSSPEGHLSVGIESLALQEEVDGWKLPQIDTLELQATLARETLSLDTFKFLVNDSQVSGQINLPTKAVVDYMTAEVKNPAKLLLDAEGELMLSEWKVEDWAELLPPILRRSGSIDGRLLLEPGYKWTGELNVADLALRPTQTMPSVDQIGARLRLQDRIVIFEQATARMGGSPVVFDGRLDLNQRERPLWYFAATGSNVPLVRTPDMILRSDIDLRVEQADDGKSPLLSGALGLRTSTLLVEFDPLSPTVESGPTSRPPFFSIAEEPFADWRFDLTLQGDSFMQVRSPYFRTKLSADFRLGGTFAEPELVGQARTVDGELRFPGAKMRLDQGEAFIEAGRLDALQLNVTGIAQKANYVITMELSQTMANPHIQFQSTPELSNAAILRLLTTGSTQGGGVGSVGLYLGQGLLGAGGMEDNFVDKFTVDVGEETTRSGKNTVGVRYDLLEDVYLNGGYDVYDAYNLDLVWSLFKR